MEFVHPSWNLMESSEELHTVLFFVSGTLMTEWQLVKNDTKKRYEHIEDIEK